MLSRQDALKVVPGQIVTARKMLGLSQQGFGVLVGCHARTIQNWESGATQPQPQQLRRLAEVAERPIAWFYENGLAA